MGRHENLVTFLLIYMTIFATSVAALIIFARRAAPYFCQQVVKREVPPSVVNGIVCVAFGTFQLLSAMFLPLPVMIPMLINLVVGTALIATGCESISARTRQQYRPPWFVGEAPASWLDWEDRPRRWRISLSSLAVGVGALCLSLAVYGTRLNTARQQQREHDEAVSRIVTVGGQVQGDSVTLAGTQITDEELTWLLQLRRIDRLNLGATEITDEGLDKIKPVLVQLRSLDLSGTQVSDQGLETLASSTRLAELRLRQTSVSGVGLSVSLRRLEVLDLGRCPVSEKGLERVAQFDLRYLYLEESAVSDAMLPQLQRLDTQTAIVIGTKLTKAAIQELRELRPDLEILH